MSHFLHDALISPLRPRLIDDMTLRRFSQETQRNYLCDVGRFASWTLLSTSHFERLCDHLSVVQEWRVGWSERPGSSTLMIG